MIHYDGMGIAKNGAPRQRKRFDFVTYADYGHKFANFNIMEIIYLRRCR
jgi:hypothetical protein